MSPDELTELATEIERCEPDDVWLLAVPYGISPVDRAALLDSIAVVCAELRRRGHVPEVFTRRVPDVGEAYAIAIEAEPGQ